ncbi:PepSY domain-containing protein [Streptomyces sp. SID10815]|uniref:PepSY domain-containing protein n=1 Tax=Streptomyces sp. SID10815 TaxID=2706027 RepID=UPI0013CAF7AC|nr:PepSY domain-containing protein [Streptomyces sp. SID10815]NEA49698.1 PepSY domain-containing protein [Streptomyces sp. SID10815]
MASAHAAGLCGVLNVSPPTKDQATYVTKENTRSWPERHDSVAVDPATGDVTDRANWADCPPAARMTSWGINAHMGEPACHAAMAVGMGVVFALLV